jgi:hypothetical protein
MRHYDGMKATAIQSNGQLPYHASTFAKVLDGRKQPIRGLWNVARDFIPDRASRTH